MAKDGDGRAMTECPLPREVELLVTREEIFQGKSNTFRYLRSRKWIE
jgi:hypothetical protein